MNRSARDRVSERRFVPLLGAAVALGAAVRLTYVLTDERLIIGGDGFDYHFSALRLADGQGYTSALGNVGAPIAHHPPGWVTVLGIVSWLGGRTLREHQLVGVVIGLGVIALTGLVGRRYFNARVGLIAAVGAALYPGFWVLEGNILSEPLGLLVLGVLLLVIADLRDRPTRLRSLGVGALCGVLALVRSEQLLLLLIVVVPVLLLARTLTLRQRIGYLAVAVVACGAVIAPWAIYNQTRFKEPVLLSTNDGGLLLIGNCPPSTYSGARLGWFDSTCNFRLTKAHPGYDRSQLDPLGRSTAVDNMRDNLDRMPVVVPARFGRLLAVFRPSQTIGFVASWMTTSTKPIWAWVISFWAILLLAIMGLIQARRSRAFILPLLGPVFIVIISVTISYGEPRYHTPADLGILVFAAVALERLVWRRRDEEEPEEYATTPPVPSDDEQLARV